MEQSDIQVAVAQLVAICAVHGIKVEVKLSLKTNNNNNVLLEDTHKWMLIEQKNKKEFVTEQRLKRRLALDVGPANINKAIQTMLKTDLIRKITDLEITRYQAI